MDSKMSEPLTYSEYTVGWVCALPKEQTAATAMLDERHPDLPKPLNDNNTYTLGSVGKHNVVIACLPKGQMGNNAAATVATRMVSTFPSIKFGLMVGIGGGIPPKVRLGDVVISTPVGKFPGVVQWDFGKAGTEGTFERVGSLNNPPSTILTAVTKLETEHELNGPRIPEYLEELKKKWPRLAPKYIKSDVLEDVLFKPEYNHVSESTADGQVPTNQMEEEDNEGEEEDDNEEESCRLCDKSKVVRRKPRDFRVHYGLIASGNQVIKDGAFRDKLNKSLDGNVLCVEMEAAGLIMTDFPCIIIRGICDYADSHKNKKWQEHAAALAAACAKELLSLVPAQEVQQMPAIKSVCDRLDGLSTDLKEVLSRQHNQEHLAILDWLTPVDYAPQQNGFFNRRQPGTGQWLLDSPEYQNWVNATKQTLFCPGIPGAGKTILTSIVIGDLTARFCKAPDVGIAYIYCNFRQQDVQNPIDLLANLLKQLAEGLPSLPGSIQELYNTHQAQRTRPSLDEILRTLHSVSDIYSRVFVVVDALDECQPSKFLSHIFNLQAQTGMSFFATSRPILDIERQFREYTWLEIQAHDEDTRGYLTGHMWQLLQFVLLRPDLQEEIKAKITEAVEGMFLLAQLYHSSLEDKTSAREIKNALKDFQKHNKGNSALDRKLDALNQAYKDAMERINGQKPGCRLLARKVLSWIICSKRPVTPLELQHALAVNTGDLNLDRDNFRELSDMVSVCAGLVVVDEDSNIIRLVHYTTQQYFEQTQNRWFPDAETDIVDTCITCLSFSVFDSGPCATNELLEERLELHQLYGYASQYWDDHARSLLTLGDNVMDFLRNKAKVDASYPAMEHSLLFFRPAVRYSTDVPDKPGLHLAARLGITTAVGTLLKEGCEPDVRDRHGQTPLVLAVYYRQAAAVQQLLEAGAAVDSIDAYYHTPLFYASKYGFTDVVFRLLEAGAEINIGDRFGQTPLSQAAKYGYTDVVQKLLEAGAAVDSTDIYNQTPLSEAAQSGLTEIVQQLLKAGATVDSADVHGATPLLQAARHGYTEIVKQLLEAGAAVDGTDNHHSTPLFEAELYGYTDVIQILLNVGASR